VIEVSFHHFVSALEFDPSYTTTYVQHLFAKPKSDLTVANMLNLSVTSLLSGQYRGYLESNLCFRHQYTRGQELMCVR
jgi:hypothetical protein